MNNKPADIKIVFFFLYLLPFADIINGIMIRKHNIDGIGSLFHLLLLLILVEKTYIKRKIKIGKYDKYSFLLIFVFAFSSVINSIFSSDFQSISLNRVEKIITTSLTISCLVNLKTRNDIKHSDINKLLNYICVFVSIVSLLANISGLGNYTYKSSKSGMTGFFTGSNEPIAIFTIINCFLTYKFYKTNKLYNLVLFLINEVNLIYAQSKSAYLFTAIFAVMVLLIIIGRILKNRKISKLGALISIPGIIGSVIIFKGVVLKNVNKFISRQNFMKNAYGKNFIGYIFSGRIDKMNQLITPIFNKNFIVTLFQFLFGQGLVFNFEQIIEIDILDAFLYGGLFAAIIIVISMISILKDIWKTTKSKLCIVLILIIYYFSCTAGHVWTGGISGTYFALICVFFMFETNIKSTNKTIS